MKFINWKEFPRKLSKTVRTNFIKYVTKILNFPKIISNESNLSFIIAVSSPVVFFWQPRYFLGLSKDMACDISTVKAEWLLDSTWQI